MRAAVSLGKRSAVDPVKAPPFDTTKAGPRPVCPQPRDLATWIGGRSDATEYERKLAAEVIALRNNLEVAAKRVASDEAELAEALGINGGVLSWAGLIDRVGELRKKAAADLRKGSEL